MKYVQIKIIHTIQGLQHMISYLFVKFEHCILVNFSLNLKHEKKICIYIYIYIFDSIITFTRLNENNLQSPGNVN